MGNENSTAAGGAKPAGAAKAGGPGPLDGDRSGSYKTDPSEGGGGGGGSGGGAGGAAAARPEEEEEGGGEVIADPKNISELQDTAIAPRPQRRLTKDDFTLIKTIGKGSFGKVLMVKKNDTGRVYAMKVLNKEKVIARKQYEHTLSERKILQDISHPFLVGMHFAFQSTSKLCVVGELAR
jgi:hypothetical protein